MWASVVHIHISNQRQRKENYVSTAIGTLKVITTKFLSIKNDNIDDAHLRLELSPYVITLTAYQQLKPLKY